MKANPTVFVYRHASKPLYIVEQQCIMSQTNTFLTPWGKLMRYTEAEMRTEGQRIVADAFVGFYDRRESDGAERRGRTPEAKRATRLLSDYWLVTISLVTPDCLRLQPICDAGRGQKRGFRENEMMFHIPAQGDDFFATLDQAFSRCCVVHDH